MSLILVGSCSSSIKPKTPLFEKKDLQVVLGFVENVSLGNGNLALIAKLDTGADTSSVNAEDVDVYEKPNEKPWVRFKLTGQGSVKEIYDLPVVRIARIKKKQGGYIERPVVMLALCVGGKSSLTEVNLADRSVFKYNMLIGRKFLEGRVLVDSNQRFMTKKYSC